jgi:hypothetical protein
MSDDGFWVMYPPESPQGKKIREFISSLSKIKRFQIRRHVDAYHWGGTRLAYLQHLEKDLEAGWSRLVVEHTDHTVLSRTPVQYFLMPKETMYGPPPSEEQLDKIKTTRELYRVDPDMDLPEEYGLLMEISGLAMPVCFDGKWPHNPVDRYVKLNEEGEKP